MKNSRNTTATSFSTTTTATTTTTFNFFQSYSTLGRALQEELNKEQLEQQQMPFLSLNRQYQISGLLWPPCVIGQAIIFLPCGFYLSSSFFFFPRLISAAADWMSTILRHLVWP